MTATTRTVPDWAHRFTIKRFGDEFWCWATEDVTPMESRSRIGKGPDPWTAMTNAVAQETTHYAPPTDQERADRFTALCLHEEETKG